MPESPTPQIEAVTLSAEEQQKQLDTIVEFLKLVHPSLLTENSECVELRGLARDYDSVPFHLRQKSFFTWHLEEKDRTIMEKWLNSRNGFPLCLYSSFYSFDYHNQPYTKAGRPAQKGKVTVAGAMYTEERPLDFDACDLATMTEYDRRFSEYGIQPLWLYSGHGYQAHILLNERVSDQNIMKFLVHLLKAKGFTHVDPKCVDAARVMRLPYTYNCKCFEKSSKHLGERSAPPLCQVVKMSTERISVKQLTDAINRMPIEDMEEYIKALSIRDGFQNNPPDSMPSDAPLPSPAAPDQSEKKATVVRQLPAYPEALIKKMSVPEFPEPIRKMLTCTKQGCRHDSLAFLLHFLCYFLGFAAKETRTILKLWNQGACEPPLENFDKEVSAAWPGYGKYDLTKIARVFGYVDLKGYMAVKSRTEISIPTDLIDNPKKYGCESICPYIAMALLEHDGKPCTMQNIAEKMGGGRKRAGELVSHLVSKNLTYQVAGIRSAGIPDAYKLTKIHPSSKEYYPLEVLVAQDYLKLYKTELSLLLYLRRKCRTVDGSFVINQSTLAEALGCDRTTISKTMAKLEKAGDIDITVRQVDRVISQLSVDILK